jgi:hypothetical protein
MKLHKLEWRGERLTPMFAAYLNDNPCLMLVDGEGQFRQHATLDCSIRLEDFEIALVDYGDFTELPKLLYHACYLNDWEPARILPGILPIGIYDLTDPAWDKFCKQSHVRKGEKR